MNAALRVLEAGAHTTLQDLGRFGLQAQGVPVAGALDTVSLRLGNLLVGNPPATGALEILHAGPTLEVCAESIRVALTGTAGMVEIRGETRCTALPWRSFCLRRGQVFRIGRLPDTTCCYLAVAGGFRATPVLGSVSTYARAGLGGFHGRTLRRGDRLPLALGAAPDRGELRLRHPPVPGHPPGGSVRGAATEYGHVVLRIVWGPQRDRFTRSALRRLREEPFTVSTESDRMGMRLEGARLSHRGGYNILSDGIATGAIQVPGSGQPILLLAEHQTTGGYPKIATVISADLPAAGRARPGDRLRFVPVTVDQAEAIRREQERWLRNLADTLVPAPAQITGIDPYALERENLISGVVPDSEPCVE